MEIQILNVNAISSGYHFVTEYKRKQLKFIYTTKSYINYSLHELSISCFLIIRDIFITGLLGQVFIYWSLSRCWKQQSADYDRSWEHMVISVRLSTSYSWTTHALHSRSSTCARSHAERQFFSEYQMCWNVSLLC